jgi:hypothetical protein
LRRLVLGRRGTGGVDVDHFFSAVEDVARLEELKTLIAVCQSKCDLETACCIENSSRIHLKI